jgi:hypothetical protein
MMMMMTLVMKSLRMVKTQVMDKVLVMKNYRLMVIQTILEMMKS